MRSAVDTNVLIRFLVDDGSEQVAAARRLFSDQRIFVPTSVLLEAEWVLRSSFRFQRAQICDALDRVLAIDSVTVQDVPLAESALALHRSGMDFGDALHLASATECDTFYTFDKKLIHKAKQEMPDILAQEP